MKGRVLKIIFAGMSLLTIPLIVTGLAGCKSAGGPASPDGNNGVSDKSVVLTVTRNTKTVTYTLPALKALPYISGLGGTISSSGAVSADNMYTGVALTEILKTAGGISVGDTIKIIGKTGAVVTLTYQQITQGDFTTYDSSSGQKVTASLQPIVFIGYEENRTPIGEAEGPLQLGIMTYFWQVTEEQWWLKGVQKIEVAKAS
jgi:hypothetical protein